MYMYMYKYSCTCVHDIKQYIVHVHMFILNGNNTLQQHCTNAL